jgi:hypothetical protein
MYFFTVEPVLIFAERKLLSLRAWREDRGSQDSNLLSLLELDFLDVPPL